MWEALKRWRTTQIWRSHNSTFEHKPQGSTPTLVHAQVEHDNWCRFSNRNPGWACSPSKVFTLRRASFTAKGRCLASDAELQASRVFRTADPLLTVLPSSRFPSTSFSSSSDSSRASPSLRRFHKCTALQRSFCTWCTWTRDCFQAHTPATGLSRHSFPRGPILVPDCGGTSHLAGCALMSHAFQRFSGRKRAVLFTAVG